MAINRDLLNQIKATLTASLPPNLTSSSHGADLYEAYVWSLVIDAARAEGAAVTFSNVLSETTLSRFYFRTAPGNIASVKRPYSHAILEFSNCPKLEAHVGIFVAGKSQVSHEC